MLLEENLKTIKDAKLDIELLRRENEKICRNNDFKIGELNVTIGVAEKELEEGLKESGEKKLECKLGWCSYRVMPDKWSYDMPKLIRWAKEDEERQEKYIKVVEEFKKAVLKKDYADGIITHDDVCDEGLTVTPQEPKFNYKLNGRL